MLHTSGPEPLQEVDSAPRARLPERGKTEMRSPGGTDVPEHHHIAHGPGHSAHPGTEPPIHFTLRTFHHARRTKNPHLGGEPVGRDDHFHARLGREILQAGGDRGRPFHRRRGIGQHNGQGGSGPGHGIWLRNPGNRLSHWSLAEAVIGYGESQSKRGAALRVDGVSCNRCLATTVVLRCRNAGALFHQVGTTPGGPTACRSGFGKALSHSSRRVSLGGGLQWITASQRHNPDPCCRIG